MTLEVDPITTYLQVAQIIVTGAGAVGAIYGAYRFLTREVTKSVRDLCNEITANSKRINDINQKIDRMSERLDAHIDNQRLNERRYYKGVR